MEVTYGKQIFSDKYKMELNNSFLPDAKTESDTQSSKKPFILSIIDIIKNKSQCLTLFFLLLILILISLRNFSSIFTENEISNLKQIFIDFVENKTAL